MAFDTGMLTVNGGLRIHVAGSLAAAVQKDPLAKQYYGRPPLRQVLLLPAGAQEPGRKYLDWHKEKIFRGLRRWPRPVGRHRAVAAAVRLPCA